MTKNPEHLNESTPPVVSFCHKVVVRGIQNCTVGGTGEGRGEKEVSKGGHGGSCHLCK